MMSTWQGQIVWWGWWCYCSNIKPSGHDVTEKLCLVQTKSIIYQDIGMKSGKNQEKTSSKHWITLTASHPVSGRVGTYGVFLCRVQCTVYKIDSRNICLIPLRTCCCYYCHKVMSLKSVWCVDPKCQTWVFFPAWKTVQSLPRSALPTQLPGIAQTVQDRLVQLCTYTSDSPPPPLCPSHILFLLLFSNWPSKPFFWRQRKTFEDKKRDDLREGFFLILNFARHGVLLILNVSVLVGYKAQRNTRTWHPLHVPKVI